MKKGITAVVTFWLLLAGVSFWWNLTDEQREHEQLAFETARAFFQQIVITRSWNAGHGGVYVPVSETVKPNPYLDDPLRDLVTQQNISLTKINPAYMTRQIAEIASRFNGVRFHITSLDPIRPQNKPTDWEKTWLQSFNEGVTESGGFYSDGEKGFFRYMAPLMVNESCLECHASQGYKVGDVRGGISVSIPYLSEGGYDVLILGYAITAIAGVIMILVGGVLLDRKRSQLVRTNEILEKRIEEREELIDQLQEANTQIKTLSGIVPICMYCKEIRDDKGYWNQLEEYISEHSSALFSHGICPQCMHEKHPEVDIVKSQKN